MIDTTLKYDDEEVAMIADLLPRAQTFDSPDELRAAINNPKIEAAYVLAPDDSVAGGYGMLIVKGGNKLRSMIPGGGYITELVIMAKTPGEALWIYENLGIPDTLH